MSLPVIKHILYCTDLRGSRRPAFRLAISLATQYQAKIVMMHVVEPLGETGLMVLDTYLPQGLREVDQHAGMKEVLQRMRTRLRAFYEDEMGEDCQESALFSDIVVTSGDPTEQIRKQVLSRDIDLVVMGSRAASSGMLGSTARKLTNRLHVPVLLVPVDG